MFIYTLGERTSQWFLEFLSLARLLLKVYIKLQMLINTYFDNILLCMLCFPILLRSFSQTRTNYFTAETVSDVCIVRVNFSELTILRQERTGQKGCIYWTWQFEMECWALWQASVAVAVEGSSGISMWVDSRVTRINKWLGGGELKTGSVDHVFEKIASERKGQPDLVIRPGESGVFMGSQESLRGGWQWRGKRSWEHGNARVRWMYTWAGRRWDSCWAGGVTCAGR